MIISKHCTKSIHRDCMIKKILHSHEIAQGQILHCLVVTALDLGLVKVSRDD